MPSGATTTAREHPACQTCGRTYRPVGYWPRWNSEQTRRIGHIVFRCACPLAIHSCWTREEYRREFGRNIKHICRGG